MEKRCYLFHSYGWGERKSEANIDQNGASGEEKEERPDSRLGGKGGTRDIIGEGGASLTFQVSNRKRRGTSSKGRPRRQVHSISKER